MQKNRKYTLSKVELFYYSARLTMNEKMNTVSGKDYIFQEVGGVKELPSRSMGSLRSFSPDSSDDERSTVGSHSAASSLSVGPVSGISSIVRSGETRQFHSTARNVAALAKTETRFPSGMSSDRDGTLSNDDLCSKERFLMR